MNKTSIEWVKNPDGTQGYTWNPITGCLNGCEYCYARKLANGRLKSRYLANTNIALDALNTKYPHIYIKDWAFDPFYPRFWEDRMGQIPLFGKSLGIFTCDMSDLFGIGIPRQWTERVLNHIGECQRHRFYLLTKQPQNLIKFSPFSDNCWVGVTVTHGMMAHVAFGYFQPVEAKVKYISFEPLLDDVSQYLYFTNLIKLVDWVIIGAQTKPYKPPKIEWVDEIILACDKANIPVFLKNNLAPIYKPCMDWSFNMKQEMPVGVTVK